MNILALDMATKTGWAHSCGQSGVWDLSIRKDESGGMMLVRFQAKIQELIRLVGVDVIVFEAVSVFQRGNANALAAKLATKLQAVVEQLCVPDDAPECRSYNLTEIKKHALGKGSGKGVNKDAMVAAATAKWPGVTIIDDNHADALWLLDLAKTELEVTQ